MWIPYRSPAEQIAHQKKSVVALFQYFFKGQCYRSTGGSLCALWPPPWLSDLIWIERLTSNLYPSIGLATDPLFQLSWRKQMVCCRPSTCERGHRRQSLEDASSHFLLFLFNYSSSHIHVPGRSQPAAKPSAAVCRSSSPSASMPDLHRQTPPHRPIDGSGEIRHAGVERHRSRLRPVTTDAGSNHITAWVHMSP